MARIYVRSISSKKNSSGQRTYYSTRREDRMIDAIDERRSDRSPSQSVEIGNGCFGRVGDDGLVTYSIGG